MRATPGDASDEPSHGFRMQPRGGHKDHDYSRPHETPSFPSRANEPLHVSPLTRYATVTFAKHVEAGFDECRSCALDRFVSKFRIANDATRLLRGRATDFELRLDQ